MGAAGSDAPPRPGISGAGRDSVPSASNTVTAPGYWRRHAAMSTCSAVANAAMLPGSSGRTRVAPSRVASCVVAACSGATVGAPSGGDSGRGAAVMLAWTKSSCLRSATSSTA
ncbi:hypothetical protein D9M70_530730 [compost metagenome]